jgi:hypothetical protein
MMPLAMSPMTSVIPDAGRQAVVFMCWSGMRWCSSSPHEGCKGLIRGVLSTAGSLLSLWLARMVLAICEAAADTTEVEPVSDELAAALAAVVESSSVDRVRLSPRSLDGVIRAERMNRLPWKPEF